MPNDAPVQPLAPPCDTLLEHGAGPDVAVLLHAAGSAPKALERLGVMLAPRIGRVRIPSFHRNGALMIGTGEEPMREAAALAASLLEPGASPDGRRVVVGHSMGGLVALLALGAGVRVDAAILYEPIVLSLLDHADAEDRAAFEFDASVIADMQAALVRADTEAGVARFIEGYGEHPWGRLPPRVREDLIARAPELLAQALATNRTRLDTDMLAAIKTPILVLHGSRSPAVTFRMARRLAAIVPNATVRRIEGAGHLGPVSTPDEVAAEIRAFLDGTA